MASRVPSTTLTQASDIGVHVYLCVRAEHPRASLELVTLTPESARGIPEAVRVHDAAVWFLDLWI